MADSPISGLPETTTVGNNDLILLEQSGVAKKIKGSNWKQYFNANVVSVSTTTIDPEDDPSATYDTDTHDLHLNLPSGDYIVSCTKTATAGLVDTYTITTALGFTYSFDVTNGEGGSPSDTTPLANGTPDPGTSPDYSRADHRHELSRPPENLLDNPWFQINQRASGSNAYSVSSSGEFVCDRWKKITNTGLASWTNADHKLTVSAENAPENVDIYQTIPGNVITNILGKKVTLSCYAFGTNLYQVTATMPASFPASDTELCRVNIGTRGVLIFVIKSSGAQVILRALQGYAFSVDKVKLEVGGESTLMFDTYPDFAAESLKCQRFMLFYPSIANNNYVHPILFGEAVSSTLARFYVKNPTKFYSTPTIKEFGSGITYRLYDATGISKTISGFAINAITANNEAVIFQVSGTDLESNRLYMLQAVCASGMGGLIFSCEI